MMSGHTRTKLNISRQSLEALEDYVCRIYQIPVLEGRYRDIEISNAIREFVDDDLGSVTEEELIALDKDLSHSFEDYSRRRSSDGEDDTLDPSDITTFERGDLEQIQPQLSENLYNDLKALVAKLNAKRSDAEKRISNSAAVDLAIYEYCTNGRTQRNAELATEIREGTDAVSVPKQADDTESNDESKPYHQEDKLAAIREDVLNRWPEPAESFEEIEGAKIPLAWFTESIDKWCTKGDREQVTDRTRQKYLELVGDEFGLTRSGADFVVGDLDGLAFERKEFEDLSKKQRVEAVHVRLIEELERHNRAQVSAADIKNMFFDGKPSDSVAHELRDLAAEADGFGLRKAHGEQKLKVDLYDVTDETILEAAGVLEKVEAKRKMDALDQAQREQQRQQYARTDGGTDI